MSSMFVHRCVVCGNTFMSKRKDAQVCTDKSTCRVKKARAERKAREDAERKARETTMDMETTIVYQTLLKQLPWVENACVAVFQEHGMSAFKTLVFELARGL
jgi:predicted  nucleic acid-binding Zn-ribbon protein